MSEPSERPLPDDLEPVVARLRANRAQAEPFELDQIKRTAMARSSSKARGTVSFMKSRFATAFTLFALLGGTGGAIAVGASGSSSSSQGGAASGQYKPGKGCGDKNHTHAKHNQCKASKKHHKAKGKSKAKKSHGKSKTKQHGSVKGVSTTRRGPSFTG